MVCLQMETDIMTTYNVAKKEHVDKRKDWTQHLTMRIQGSLGGCLGLCYRMLHSDSGYQESVYGQQLTAVSHLRL